jgi:hypothetical protein
MKIPYLNKSVVRVHKTGFAIALFLILFITIHNIKPTLLYEKDGSFRRFGVGYRQKTVVPIWLVAVFLSILCYLAVLVFLLVV